MKQIKWFLVLLFFVNAVFPVHAEKVEKNRKVTMILVNGLSFDEVQAMEQKPFSAWLRQGYLGGMNLRTAGATNDINNVVTIGAGNRAVGSREVSAAYNQWETIKDENLTAAEKIIQLTGKEMKQNEVVLPGIQYVISNNELHPYSVTPGLLGTVLEKSGIKVAVLGNSDLGSSPYRLAPFITMNKNGITTRGDISPQTLERDKARPYGVKTNYDYLINKGNQWRSETGLLVFELGDLHRLYSLHSQMEEDHFLKEKNLILSEINQFISHLVRYQDDGELIMIVSPMVHEQAVQEKALLAPVVFIPPGNENQTNRGGVLSSSTTKRDGVIANIDIAPTILQWLLLSVPDEMIGRSITTTEVRLGAFTTVSGNNEHTINDRFWSQWAAMHHVYQTRSGVLYYYVTLQVILMLIAAFIWLKVNWSYAYSWVRIALLTLMISPVVFLLEPVIPVLLTEVQTLVVFGLAALIVAFMLEKLPNPILFLSIALFSWLPVTIDTMTGASLMKQSYLGYDPLIGARYYGIGNEYMGVVIGSSILFISSWMEKNKVQRGMKIISSLLFLFLLLVFALPFWGTNAGGALTAVIGFTVTFIKLFEVPVDKSLGVKLLIIIFAGFFILISMNLFMSDSEQSHIGRAAGWLINGDMEKIFNIIERKLQMNWHLLQVSSWSKVFVTSLLILALFLLRPRGSIEKFNQEYPYLMRGITGIVAAAIVTLIVNDSGIVAAATTIIYAVIPLLILALQHKEEVSHPGVKREAMQQKV